jgi:hypothetical protein
VAPSVTINPIFSMLVYFVSFLFLAPGAKTIFWLAVRQILPGFDGSCVIPRGVPSLSDLIGTYLIFKRNNFDQRLFCAPAFASALAGRSALRQ